MATVAVLLVSKFCPEIRNGPPILTVVIDNVIEGRGAGVGIGVGEGLGDGSAAVTWRMASSGQEPFQQICTM
jgi:hypothetical protein